MIALIDYHAGNLTSVKKALASLGAEIIVAERPSDLASASGIIVPGVGHFSATQALDPSWVQAIIDHVGEGRPLLGICLGMHWLFEESDEAPGVSGLGLIGGRCHRLGTSTGASKGVKIPHVGWNSVTTTREGWITDGVPSGTQMYFSHSYVVPLTGDTIAVTDHGESFAAIVQRAHVAGVQFHPEKSGDAGLRILQNFVELAH